MVMGGAAQAIPGEESSFPIPERSRELDIETQYLSLAHDILDLRGLVAGGLKEYSGSGAFCVGFEGRSEIIYSRPDGEVYLISSDHRVATRYFPKINTGSFSGESAQYSFLETWPRVHDIICDEKDIYVSYDRYVGDGIVFAVSKLQRIGGRMEWADILISPTIEASYYALGQGGRLLKDGDSLYISLGDYSMDRRNNKKSDYAAQNDALPWGKLIKYSLSKKESIIFAKGLRNPYGLANMDGNIYIADHGPRGGDKLLRVKFGDNFGWPFSSSGTHYSGYSPYSSENNQRHTPELYFFTPSIAPTQIIDASSISPSWNGDLLLGSLKGQAVFRVKPSGTGISNVEEIYIGQRIRDLDAFSKTLYVLTDDYQMHLLTATSAVPSNPLPISCSVCHSYAESAQYKRYAPPLSGLESRFIAAAPGFRYTKAFSSKSSLRWTKKSLKSFLLDVQSFAPGTSMPQPHISEEEVDAIISQIMPGMD